MISTSAKNLPAGSPAPKSVKTLSSILKSKAMIINNLEYQDTIKYDKWEIGKEYSKRIVIKNIGRKTERISYELPSTLSFVPDYPRIISLSSGMSCSILVRFRPTEQINYEDQIGFQTISGSFKIRLLAKLPQHRLVCAKSIDFGTCPVATDNHVTFELTNSGDLITFLIWKYKAPFVISPAEGSLAPGQTTKITISCQTHLASVIKGSLVCLYGNQDVPCKKKIVNVAIRTEFPLIGISSSHLDFGLVDLRSSKDISITATNAGRVVAKFDLARQTKTDTVVFNVSKTSGTLLPGASTSLIFRFAPAVPTQECKQTYRMSITGGQFYDIECTGKSLLANIEIRPSVVDFGHVKRSEEVRKAVNFRNKTQRTSVVQLCTPPSSKFSFDFQTFAIPPESSVVVPFSFVSNDSGHFCQNIAIWVQDNPPRSLNMLATCAKDFNEIPPGRHERLVQEFKTKKSSEGGSAIGFADPVIQLKANSCKYIPVSNNSKAPHVFSVRKLNSASLKKSVLEPNESTFLMIEGLGTTHEARVGRFALDARDTQFDSEKPEFMRMNTKLLDIIVHPVVDNQKAIINIPEDFLEIKLPPTSPTNPISLALPVQNTSHVPAILNWKTDSIFTISPRKQILLPNSTSLFTITADPMSLGTFQGKLVADINGSDPIQISAQISCENCKVILKPRSGDNLVFTPVSTHVPTSKTISLINVSSVPASFKWITQPESSFRLLPPEGTVAPFGILETTVHFSSSKPLKTEEVIECKYQGMNSVLTEAPVMLSLKCIAEASDSNFRGDSTKMNLGSMIVNTATMKTVRIFNESTANEWVDLICENEKGEVLPDILQSSEAIIYAKTASPITFHFSVSEAGPHTFHIYAKSKLFAQPKRILCTATGTGVFSSMKVVDVASFGKSKNELWRFLSIDKLNDVLARKYSHSPAHVTMDLGSSLVDDQGTVFRLALNNNGTVPAEWHIYPTSESFEDMEMHKLLNVSPPFDHIKPDNTSIVTFTFTSKTPGKKRCTLMLELAQGFNVDPLQVQLEIVVFFITPDDRKLTEIPEKHINVHPFFTNLSIIPNQMVGIPNPLPKDCFEYVITAPSESYVKLVSDKDGQVNINDPIEMILGLKNQLCPESWTETFKIVCNGSVVMSLRLHFRRESLMTIAECPGVSKIPEFSLLSLPNQYIKLSRDAICLGVVPRRSIHRFGITVENTSKRHLKLYWENIENVNIRPNICNLPPSSNTYFDFEVVLGDDARVYDLVIPASVEDPVGVIVSSRIKNSVSIVGVTSSRQLPPIGVPLPAISRSNMRRASSSGESKQSMTSFPALAVTLSINAVALSLGDFTKLGGDVSSFMFNRDIPGLIFAQEMFAVDKDKITLVEDLLAHVVDDALSDLRPQDLEYEGPHYYAAIDTKNQLDGIEASTGFAIPSDLKLMGIVQRETHNLISDLIGQLTFDDIAE